MVDPERIGVDPERIGIEDKEKRLAGRPGKLNLLTALPQFP